MMLHDDPISSESNWIWTDDDLEKVNALADSFAKIAEGNLGQMPRVSAVYGPWGSGKSSLLRIIRQTTEDRLREKQDSLFFATFDAPYYEVRSRSRRKDMSFFLATCIVKVAHKADTDAGRKKLVDFIEQFLGKYSDLEKSEDFENGLYRLCERDDVDRIIEKALADRTCVVLIDDLDRCQSAQSVWRLLKSLVRWQIKRLFFVLAVDKEFLIKFARQWPRTSDNPELSEADVSTERATHALEKYVNFQIDVPPFEARLRPFVERLLEHHYSNSKRLAEVLKSDEAIDLLRYGLARLTPRSVKRFMSNYAGELQKAFEVLSNEEALKKLKRKLMQVTYEDFYERYYKPFADGVPTELIFPSLEKRAQEYVDNIDGPFQKMERFEFMLRRDSKSLETV